MTELPDVSLYLEALTMEVGGRPLSDVKLLSPFVLRSVDPPIATVRGATILGFSRVGKRLVFEFGDELFLVLHLMIAGRLKWRPNAGAHKPLPVPSSKLTLAVFEFEHGRLYFTEAGSKKRASLQLVRGAAALRALAIRSFPEIDLRRIKLQFGAYRVTSKGSGIERGISFRWAMGDGHTLSISGTGR